MVSETWNQDCDAVVYTIVLILVVVEDGLRGHTASHPVEDAALS